MEVRPGSCGYDQALREDILRSGVEIKLGAVHERELIPGHYDPVHYIWFRRQGQQGNAEPVSEG